MRPGGGLVDDRTGDNPASAGVVEDLVRGDGCAEVSTTRQMATRGLAGCGKTRALYQGTTLVVP